MSDSDRQLYFADFVIELQAAEDDKRRRIRDARRRAEKAQRESYRDFLRKLAAEGKILPHTRWRSVEELVSADESFKLVEAQDRDSPHGLFEEFLEEWDDAYRRERNFLSHLVHPENKKEIEVTVATTYDEFTKLLLDGAAYSPDVYGDARRIINREEPISSARLYYNELVARANSANNTAKRQAIRRQSMAESSEDEGGIIEDGEVEEETGDKPEKTPETQKAEDGAVHESTEADGIAKPSESPAKAENDGAGEEGPNTDEVDI